MDKFKNKYRIKSARAEWWDYSSNGAYFITICTEGQQHYFGGIESGVMLLNSAGQIAQAVWTAIPNQFDWVRLADFVVMPNHVHGIVVIDRSDDVRARDGYGRDAINRVSTTRTMETDDTTRTMETDDTARTAATDDTARTTATKTNKPPTNNPGGFAGKKNPMLNKNLARIIRWYKGRCTYDIRKTNPSFGWQARYHDHIIRNRESFDRIAQYIRQNPVNWENDKFYG